MKNVNWNPNKEKLVTPLFIEMARKATELQESYKPEEGDLIVCSCDSCLKDSARVFMVHDYDMDYIEKRDLTDVYHVYADMVRTSGDGYFGAFWDARLEEGPGGFVWLPSQERLQQLVLDKTEYQIDDAVYKLLADFQGWTAHTKWMPADSKGNLTLQTMDELWLAFTMLACHQKKWCGDNWA
jgi:hypothetical protein